MLQRMKTIAQPFLSTLCAAVLVYAALSVPAPRTTSADASSLPRHVLDEHALHQGDMTLRQASPMPASIPIPPNGIQPVHAEQGCQLNFSHAGDYQHGNVFCSAAPGVVIQHEGVNLCNDHDVTKWHPLVKRDGSGAITCTYGHEHHADPNSVNDLFGPPGAWYGGTQQISYPWQTSSALGLENAVKHEGYKWYVQRDAPCQHPNNPDVGCFRSWRIAVHTLGTAADAVVRHHSFSMEAVVEHQGRVGIVRHGGWMDTGHLALAAESNGQIVPVCPPMSSNPETFTCGTNHHREASGTNLPAPLTGHNGFAINWYAIHTISQVGTVLEEWGPIDYADPTHRVDHPADLKMNNSTGRIENMAFNAYGPNFYFAPWTANGLVTFNGYTDSAGNPVQGCTTPSAQCVPLKMEGAPSITYAFNAAGAGLLELIEYDVDSPVTGRSLIRFPN